MKILKIIGLFGFLSFSYVQSSEAVIIRLVDRPDVNEMFNDFPEPLRIFNYNDGGVVRQTIDGIILRFTFQDGNIIEQALNLGDGAETQIELPRFTNLTSVEFRYNDFPFHRVMVDNPRAVMFLADPNNPGALFDFLRNPPRNQEDPTIGVERMVDLLFEPVVELSLRGLVLLTNNQGLGSPMLTISMTIPR
ncbi:MAG: hypothetical protein Q8S31_10625 [Alphaproteobacteria bacterium]|nr:hypothetical protein [Alphaproteobacteria bacterium]